MISEKMSKLLERSAAMSSMYTESARLKEKYGAENVYDFGMGNPNLPAPDSIRETSIRVLQETDPWYLHHYMSNNGFPEAREKIAASLNRRFGEHFDANNIMMCTGAAGGLNCLLKVLMDPGQEILTFAPYFGEYDRYADNVGCTLTTVPPNIPIFQPDPAALEKCVTEKTRAVLIDNPNNPTGAVYSKELLMEIVEIARQHNLIIFADEIYDKILYDAAQHHSIAALAPDLLTVTFNGLSKTYRVAGFRQGWMVLNGPKKHAKGYIEGLEMLASMRLCANVPAQHAIQTALGGYQSISEFIVPGGRLYEQRNRAWELINDIPGVSCVKPNGALYMFPKIDAKRFNIHDDQKMVLDFLLQEKVLLVQGTAFNWPWPDHVRIVTLPREDDLEMAISRFGRFLSGYHQ